MNAIPHIELTNVLCWDWLNFTSFVDSVDSIKQLLGLDRVTWVRTVPPASLAQFYNAALFFGNIFICFDPKESFLSGGSPDNRVHSRRSVCVSMSGGGCRFFENFSTLGENCWNLLFIHLLSQPDNYNITRVDIAYDDFNKLLDLDLICRLSDNWSENLITLYRSGQEIKGKGEDRSRTQYFGSKRSENFMRIYDKQAEKRTSYHWIRWEISLKKEYAFNFLKQFVDSDLSLGQLFSSLVLHYIRFIDSDLSDKHNGDVVFLDWYLNFLESSSEISVASKYDVDYTLDKAHRYLKQFENSLALFITLYGRDALLKLVADDIKSKSEKGKFPEKYELLFSKYVASFGLDPPLPSDHVVQRTLINLSDDLSLSVDSNYDYSEGVPF